MINYLQLQTVLRSSNIHDVYRAIENVKDKMEVVHASEFSNFLNNLFTPFRELMINIPPQNEDNIQNKIRLTILEVLSKFPHTEPLKSYLVEIIDICLKVFDTDNEDNSVVAIKIVFELHKTYRQILETKVQPVLDLITQIYSNSLNAIRNNFGSLQVENNHILINSMNSFKVLTECPLIVMFLLQIYPNFLKKTLQNLLPLMINTLTLNPYPQQSSIPQEMKNRYKELIAAQVKTLSFVVYLLRGSIEYIKPYESTIANSIFSLLLRCPEDSLSTRKDLLIATKHVISSPDFRKCLFPYIDDLLNEQVLLGQGRPESIRHIAYSILGDIVQHVKDTLNLTQLGRVINLYTVVLHDFSLPVSTHITTVRLLLAVIDRLNILKSTTEGLKARSLLTQIFKSLVDKLGTLRSLIVKAVDINIKISSDSAKLEEETTYWLKRILALEEYRANEQLILASSRSSQASNDESNHLQEYISHANICASTSKSDSTSCILFGTDSSLGSDMGIREMKQLIKTIIWGVKGLMMSLYQNKDNTQFATTDTLSSDEKLKVIFKLFSYGIECCKIFLSSGGKSSSNPSISSVSSSHEAAETKEALEYFINAITLLDSDTIRNLFQAKISFLYELSTTNNMFLAIIQQILSHNVSNIFNVDIVLTFFTSNMSDLSLYFNEKKEGMAKKLQLKSATLLKIFRCALASINTYPEAESVLVSHLKNLIFFSIRYANESRMSINYYFVLRLLFRAVTNLKSEQCIQTIAPLYPSILDGLRCLLHRTDHKTVQNILLELCLTIPARISTQLNHITILLQCIARALKAQSEVTNIALKFFELILENTSPDHIFTIMNRVPNLGAKIMEGILSHLKPHPYPLGMISFRILGKLGGDNQIKFRELLPSNTIQNKYNYNKDLKTDIFKTNLSCNLYSDELSGETIIKDYFSLDFEKSVYGACEILECTPLSLYPTVSEGETHDILYIDAVSQLDYSNNGLSESTDNEFSTTSNSNSYGELEIPPNLVNLYTKTNDDMNTVTSSSSKPLTISPVLFPSYLEEWNSFKINVTDEINVSNIVAESLYISSISCTQTKKSAYNILVKSLLYLIQWNSIYSIVTIDGICRLKSKKCESTQKLNDNEEKNGLISFNEIELLKKILYSIVVASTEICLQKDVYSILNCICTHFSLSSFSFFNFEDNNDVFINKDHVFMSINSVIVSALCDSRTTVIKCGLRLLNVWLIALNDVMLKISFNSASHVRDDMIIEDKAIHDNSANKKINLDYLNNVSILPLSDLVKRACIACYSITWNERMSGVKIIFELFTSLPDKWCLLQIHNVIDALLTVFKHSSNEIVAIAYNDIFTTMKLVINSTYTCNDSNTALLPTEKVLNILVRSCFHSCTLVRLLAKITIRDISNLYNITDATLLDAVKTTFQELISQNISEMKEMNYFEIGLTSGLLYCITNNIIKIDKVALSILVLSLNMADKEIIPSDPLKGKRLVRIDNHINEMSKLFDEDIAFHFSIFPFTFPNTVEHRINLIKLIKIFFTELPENINSITLGKNTDVIPIIDYQSVIIERFSQFLFQSLVLPNWDEVLVEVQKSLYAINNSNKNAAVILEKVFVEEIVNGRLLSMFHSLQDLRLFTLPLLQCYDVLLCGLSKSSINDIGEKFTGYLRLWLEPEKIASLNLWPLSDEQQIASKLLKIIVSMFPILNINTSIEPVDNENTIMIKKEHFIGAFSRAFEELIMTIINISRCQYRFRNGLINAPYFSSIIDVMKRYPNESLNFLFSTQYLSKIDIFNCVMKILRQKSNLSTDFMNLFLANNGLNIIENCIFKPSLDSNFFVTSDENIITMKQMSLDATYHASCVVRRLTKNLPKLLIEHPYFLTTLKLLWRRVLSQSINSSNIINNSVNSIKIHHQSKNLSKTLLSYCIANLDDPDVIFDLINILNVAMSPIDFLFVSDSIQYTMVPLFSERQIKNLLIRYFTIFSHQNTSLEWKVKSLQLLISPVIIRTFQDEKMKLSLYDFELVKLIMQRGLGAINETKNLQEQRSNSDNIVITSEDALVLSSIADSTNITSVRNSSIFITIMSDLLKIELLKFSTLFLEHLNHMLKPYKKDLIKFPWNSIKADDILMKYWAYVNICRFVAAFDSPPKIVIQVYVFLLRSMPSEGKDIVLMALDILVPVLPYRLSNEDFSKVIKWTKKILYEEAVNSIPLLNHIWSVVVRYADIFYPYRSQLVPQMINAMSRIGLQPTASIESRQISLGMASTIISWEWYSRKNIKLHPLNSISNGVSSLLKRDDFSNKNGIEGSENKKIKIDHSSSYGDANGDDKEMISSQDIHVSNNNISSYKEQNVAPQVVEKNEFTIPSNMLQSLSNFLVRFSFLAVDSKDNTISRLYPRSLHIYTIFISLFPLGSIKINYFDRLLQHISDSKNHASNSSKENPIVSDSKIISIMEHLIAYSYSPDGNSEFFRQCISYINGILVSIFESDNLTVHKLFRVYMTKVLSSNLLIPTVSTVYNDYFNHLKQYIEEGLEFTPITDPKLLHEGFTMQCSNVKLLLQSLKLMEEICYFNPGWIAAHASSMLRVCQYLLTDHIVKAAKSSKTDIFYSSTDNINNLLGSSIYPSPWSSFLSDITNNTNNLKNIETTSTLILVLKCLFHCIDNGFLMQQKKSFISIICNIIESSDSPVILTLTAEYCTKWITCKTTAISTYEQWMLYKQIKQSYGRLPEYTSCPCSIYWINIIIVIRTFYNTNGDIIFNNVFGEKASEYMSKNCDIAGLFCPHKELRNICNDRISNQWKGYTLYDKLISFFKSDLSIFSSRNILSILPSILMDVLIDNKVNDSIMTSTISSTEELDLNEYVSYKLEDEIYSNFLTTINNCNKNTDLNLLKEIGELSLVHNEVGEALLNDFITQMWADISQDKRQEFIITIEDFITINRPQAKMVWPSSIPGQSQSQNIVQSLLHICCNLEPKPQFSIEFLGSIGCYSAWHDVESLLESYCSSGDTIRSKISLDTNIRLLQNIDDRGLILSNYRLYHHHPATDLAFSLEMYEKFQDAESTLAEFIQSPPKFDVNVKLETLHVALWEKRWVENAKELSHWNMLSDFSNSVHIPTLSIESATMRSDWETVKRQRMCPSVVAQNELNAIHVKLCDTMLHIIEKKHQEADRLCLQSVQMSLLRWQNLPNYCGGSSAHKNILHIFHRIIELRETIVTMSEVMKASEKNILPDVKGIIKTWKNRLPASSQGLHVWDSIFQWRVYIFHHIKEMHEKVTLDVDKLAALHDTPWTILTLAKTARKHGLYDVSLNTLAKLNSISHMDVNEAFTQLREQILSRLSTGNDYIGVHNIINSTNMDYFDSQQKSELFRLKALCQQHTNLLSDAQDSFAISIQLCDKYAKGWLSWGHFCYSNLEQIDSKTNDVAFVNINNISSSIICILKAIEFDSQPARMLLGRVLWLVSHNIGNDDSIGTILQTYSQKLPVWIWLPYLSELVNGLSFLEGKYYQSIITKIVNRYPNSISFHLLSCNDSYSSNIRNRINSRTTSKISNNPYSDEILNNMKRSDKGQILCKSIKINEYIQTLTNSTYHENLLDVLTNLFNTFIDDENYRLNELISVDCIQLFCDGFFKFWTDFIIHFESNEMFLTELNNDFYCIDSNTINSIDNFSRSNMEQYLSKLTLWDSIGLIRKWIKKLNVDISNNNNKLKLKWPFTISDLDNNLTLYSTSLSANSLNNSNYVEIPGQYENIISIEPRSELHVKIIRIIPLVTKNSINSAKVLQFLGSDGILYNFKVSKIDSSQNNYIEYRYNRLCQVIDWTLQQHLPSKNNDLILKYNIPILTSSTSSIVLMNDVDSGVNLNDLYNQYCIQNHFDPMEIMINNRLSIEESIITNKDDEKSNEITKQLLHKNNKYKSYLVCCSTTPDHLLTDYFNKVSISGAQYQQTRKFFATQLGINSAIQYLINSKPINSTELLIAQNGCAYNQWLHSSYSIHSSINNSMNSNNNSLVVSLNQHDIPFRITRNIGNVLSPSLLYGTTSLSIGNTLDGILASSDVLEINLCYFFFESLSITNKSLSDRIDNNVLPIIAKSLSKETLDKIKIIAPSKQCITNSSLDSNILPPIDVHINKLIDESTNDENRAQTKISFKSWL